MRDEITGLKREILHTIQGLGADLEGQQPQNSRILGLLRKPTNNSSAVDMDALMAVLAQMEIRSAKIITSLALLESLTFDQMDFRHSKIHDAHPSTFMWMFSNKFKLWLQSTDPVFWISGKPGSGKSTLMKYLVDNPETPAMLHEWSGQEDQVIASYFFWINGTEMQRSQEGLLQALLYELLRKCPEHIQLTLPDVWKATISTDSNHDNPNPKHNWKRSDLLDAFRRLTQLDLSGTKFCIFIDGLDEYEGDHDELIDLIRDLTKLDVKLCVASRPWNVFEDAFGQNLDCKLYLQDLNKGDIQRYVDDKLRSRSDFQRIQASNRLEANEMIEEIIEKSQGVFLWVFLVVRSLTEGLRNHDRFSQLRQRLRAFPSDLTEFFSHIFKSMDPTYRVQAAHMCQVTLSAAEPLTPLGYWYLDEEEDNPNIALTMPIKPRTAQVLDYYMEEMKIRINGRCKGLLEVTTIERNGTCTSQVDFLHRTVKDFLKTTEMQLIFVEWQHPGFNPDFAICKASLAELKSVALTPHYPAIPSIFVPLRNFFYSAGMYEKTHQIVDSQTGLMNYYNELEQTITKHALVRSGEPKNYPWDRFGVESLLEVAIGSDLQVFVRARLNDPCKPVSKAERIKLLEHGLPFNGGPKILSPKMVVLILSISPPITLTTTSQDAIARYFDHLEHDALLDAMKEITKLSKLKMSSGHVQSQSLDNILFNKLSKEEIEDLQRASTANLLTASTKASAKPIRGEKSSLRTTLRRFWH
jgi:hypothetical protein